MRKQLLAILFLLFAVARAEALEYTDVYYDPLQPGWGLFVVQSDTFQFVTFFIYGPDGKPVWYAAGLELDETGAYSGKLLAATGTYFADPWQGFTPTEVGTASFAPTDIYSGTLTYALTGGPTVIKSVQRQTLTSYKMTGNYSGSMSGAITDCTDPADNSNAFRGRFSLAVTQTEDASIALVFTFVDPNHEGLVCTLTGPLTHYGRLYQVAAQSICNGNVILTPGPFADTVNSLHPTGQGIEGRWSGPQNRGCNVNLRFSAVIN